MRRIYKELEEKSISSRGLLGSKKKKLKAIAFSTAGQAVRAVWGLV